MLTAVTKEPVSSLHLLSRQCSGRQEASRFRQGLLDPDQRWMHAPCVRVLTFTSKQLGTGFLYHFVLISALFIQHLWTETPYSSCFVFFSFEKIIVHSLKPCGKKCTRKHFPHFHLLLYCCCLLSDRHDFVILGRHTMEALLTEASIFISRARLANV